jgi:predicted nucleic acid-binding protein
MMRDGVLLVDTSSWIETLRVRGDVEVRERISGLVMDGTAAWCNIIRLELWQGVRGDREKAALRSLEQVVRNLQINDEVWTRSIELSQLARSNGLTVQAPDLLIVATAQHHRVAIDSCDAHFDRLIELR